MQFPIHQTEARSILTRVTGFIAEAGFTHSLTPARNCTFACTYCYVPTMRVQGGLKPEDWRHWGEFTTAKVNAAELLRRELRPGQAVYCSPLTDPYQPAEEQAQLMPGILEAVAERPPAVFVIQTRGPLILRDLPLLRAAAERTQLRVSLSVTTNREEISRMFEPRGPSVAERLRAVRALRDAGIPVSVTLSPLLPCDPEELVRLAVEASDGPLVADPFHVREAKPSGATTRMPSLELCRRKGFGEWLQPDFQRAVLGRMAEAAAECGREFGWGPAGFGMLARRSIGINAGLFE